jgi:hypothetical protein
MLKTHLFASSVASILLLSVSHSHAAEAFADAPATKPAAAKSPGEAGIKTVSLFDGKTLDGWILVPDESWVVKDGAMASTGNGRGMIYTKDDFSKFRLLFTIRHLKSEKDHHAGVLIFCSRPEAGAKPIDALAGIQFQVPLGGSWDYRNGKNNSGKGLFTRLVKPEFDPHQWSRVEILADAATGEARMAVAQPVGSKAIEVLQFKDPTAGKKGPIAWQMHNATLLDEYKDVEIEIDPKDFDLVTTR